MTEEKAREILGDHLSIEDNTIGATEEYVAWPIFINGYYYSDKCELDGNFAADELEAIAWWMRNKEVE